MDPTSVMQNGAMDAAAAAVMASAMAHASDATQMHMQLMHHMQQNAPPELNHPAVLLSSIQGLQAPPPVAPTTVSLDPSAHHNALDAMHFLPRRVDAQPAPTTSAPPPLISANDEGDSDSKEDDAAANAALLEGTRLSTASMRLFEQAPQSRELFERSARKLRSLREILDRLNYSEADKSAVYADRHRYMDSIRKRAARRKGRQGGPEDEGELTIEEWNASGRRRPRSGGGSGKQRRRRNSTPEIDATSPTPASDLMTVMTPGMVMPSSIPNSIPSTIPSTIPGAMPSAMPDTIPGSMPTAMPTSLPSSMTSGLPSGIPSALTMPGAMPPQPTPVTVPIPESTTVPPPALPT